MLFSRLKKAVEEERAALIGASTQRTDRGLNLLTASFLVVA
jgi:hypothetical protein